MATKLKTVISAAAILFVMLISASAQNDVTKMPLLYKVGGQENVKIQQNIVYKKVGETELGMDIYSPPSAKEKLPAIIFISGSGNTKDWQIFKDYGAVTAAQGMIAVQFNRRFANGSELPIAREDTKSLIDFVRQNGDRYGIDTNNIGIWVYSGGGYFLDLAMQEDQPFIKVIVAYYGIDRVETFEQVRKIGDKLPPIYMVRAGQDQPNLNNAITLFALQAISQNVRFTLVNYRDGKHSFDILDDTPETRKIIINTFQFIKDEFEIK